MTAPLWALLGGLGLLLWLVAWPLLAALDPPQAPYALAAGAACLICALWDYADGGPDA